MKMGTPPETILIVDDAPAILSTLAGILADEGYDVQTAESGEEALESLQTVSPAVILLDILMPGLDGVETLKRILVSRAEVMVIMMSGHGSAETAAQTMKLGAYDYIEKPVSLEKVVAIVKHAIDAYRLRKENRELKARIERMGAHTSEGLPL